MLHHDQGRQLVSSDSGIASDFDDSVRKMWRAYWACASNNALRNASWKTHMNAMNKFVVPVGAWRWSRWPPQRHYATELDKVQKSMCSAFFHIAPASGETGLEYIKRRNREIKHGLRNQTKFSTIWKQRAQAWHSHLLRHDEHHATKLMKWHDAAWLQAQRYKHLPQFSIKQRCWTVHAGRTDTRISAGNVHMRWEQGLACL